MKKIMIAVMAVAFAAVAQAVTVNWGSGAFYTAASKNGGWSDTGVVTANALVTMKVFLVDAETYATVSVLDQKGIYNWASEKTANYTAQNLNTSSALIAAATAKDTNFAGNTTFYSILTAEYTDATYGDMYMAATATATTAGSGTKSISNIFGGASTLASGGVRDWQAAAVPEPTSGLLLLLGMAGLALKRKVA